MEKCPWNTAPKTIEQLIEASAAQGEWEKQNGKSPYEWNMLITRELFTDIALLLLQVAKKVGA